MDEVLAEDVIAEQAADAEEESLSEGEVAELVANLEGEEGSPERDEGHVIYLPREVAGLPLDLVKHVASRLVRRLSHVVRFDDLYSAGLMGLVQASHGFNPGRGVDFRTYAKHRVYGAMLDELRRLDIVSRSMRRMIRGGIAEDFVVPREVDIEAATGVLDVALDAEEELDRRRALKSMRAEIEELPPRLQLVLRLRLSDEWTLREIADHLGVTQARACQLVREAREKLADALEGNFSDYFVEEAEEDTEEIADSINDSVEIRSRDREKLLMAAMQSGGTEATLAQLMAVIEDHLSRLEELERNVLELFLFHEETIEEVASMCHISPVRARVLRMFAVLKLCSLMAPQEHRDVVPIGTQLKPRIGPETVSRAIEAFCTAIDGGYITGPQIPDQAVLQEPMQNSANLQRIKSAMGIENHKIDKEILRKILEPIIHEMLSPEQASIVTPILFEDKDIKKVASECGKEIGVARVLNAVGMTRLCLALGQIDWKSA